MEVKKVAEEREIWDKEEEEVESEEENGTRTFPQVDPYLWQESQ